MILDNHLSILNEKERANIRRDFEEYFENGRVEGKMTEEIIDSLGAADTIAAELLAAYNEEDFTQPVEVSQNTPYKHVKIHVKGANLAIVPTDADTAQFEVKDKDEITDAEMFIENDTLVVNITRQERKQRRFLFITIIGSFSKSDVILHLPKRHYEKISVKNDDGFIDVSQATALQFNLESDNGKIITDAIRGNSLHAETSNGRIILSNMRVNEVEASTSNGRIISENSEALKFKFDTDNGRIELKNVHGSIDARTQNGRIEAEMDIVRHSMKLRTANGSIKLTSPEKLSNITILAETAWGGSTIYNESTKSYIAGAGENIVQLNTQNGKIAVGVME